MPIMAAPAAENGAGGKSTAAQKRRLRAKRRKTEKRLDMGARAKGEDGRQENGSVDVLHGVEVEYVSAPNDFSFLENNGASSPPPDGKSSPEAKAASPPAADADEHMEEANGKQPAEDPEVQVAGIGATPGLGSTAGLSANPGLGATAGLGANPGLGSIAALAFTAGLGAPAAGMQAEANGDKKSLEDEFGRIFDRFTSAEELMNPGKAAKGEEHKEEVPVKKEVDDGDAAVESDSDAEGDINKMSKKKRKLNSQMTIAELKQLCPKPDVVECWDVTAADPQLLVYLKKRKYLQGKRGIEKPAFVLPEYIEATGISDMRAAYKEKEEEKKVKQKQRDRMQPKLGKMDIDYTVLYDAFFKHQKKPKLSGLGELYYEGKEFEPKLKDMKPGLLSAELRQALGMAEGAPPPWLINMQRYGPPPSYPSLKIPGLNAPIPPDASFGYHPGGWGKPPVDEQGNPLYGDVFGQYEDEVDSDREVDKSWRWGTLDSDAEESSEEEEDEEEDEDEDGAAADGRSIDDDAVRAGISSVASGFASSLPSGIETPDMIDLRKATDQRQKHLYTVLEQKAANVGQGALMGSDHIYVMPKERGEKEKWPVGAMGKRTDMKATAAAADVVEVTLDPEELEDQAAIQRLYDQGVQENRLKNKREDFSDMVAHKAAQQKRKMAAKDEGKKESFKF